MGRPRKNPGLPYVARGSTPKRYTSILQIKNKGDPKYPTTCTPLRRAIIDLVIRANNDGLAVVSDLVTRDAYAMVTDFKALRTRAETILDKGSPDPVTFAWAYYYAPMAQGLSLSNRSVSRTEDRREIRLFHAEKTEDDMLADKIAASLAARAETPEAAPVPVEREVSVLDIIRDMRAEEWYKELTGLK